LSDRNGMSERAIRGHNLVASVADTPWRDIGSAMIPAAVEFLHPRVRIANRLLKHPHVHDTVFKLAGGEKRSSRKLKRGPMLFQIAEGLALGTVCCLQPTRLSG
jgi:hypothetical protein